MDSKIPRLRRDRLWKGAVRCEWRQFLDNFDKTPPIFVDRPEPYDGEDDFLRGCLRLVLEGSHPDEQAGRGWQREHQVCKQGHNDWGHRSDGRGGVKRYCITCNRERKSKNAYRS